MALQEVPGEPQHVAPPSTGRPEPGLLERLEAQLRPVQQSDALEQVASASPQPAQKPPSQNRVVQSVESVHWPPGGLWQTSFTPNGASTLVQTPEQQSSMEFAQSEPAGRHWHWPSTQFWLQHSFPPWHDAPSGMQQRPTSKPKK